MKLDSHYTFVPRKSEHNVEMDIIAALFRIKEFILAGMHSLPIILGGISLLLACATANSGFAILFVCLAGLVPILTFGLNKLSQLGIIPLAKWIWSKFSDVVPEFGESAESVCRLAPFAEASAAAGYPSYWSTAIVFFFTFLFMNGLSLYNFAAGDKSDSDKVGARKTHAVIGMALSILFGVGLLIWRGGSGCENGLGLSLSLVFVGIAIGFFKMFESCGLLRVIDLYGIGARLLPTSATAAPTQVCFPVSDKSS